MVTKPDDQPKNLAGQFRNVLTHAAKDAWPEVGAQVDLLDSVPQWEGDRWVMACWQAGGERRLTVGIAETAIHLFAADSAPGFEQAAPMLQWENPFVTASKKLWREDMIWDLAELEVSKEPQQWMSQRGFEEPLVYYALPLQQGEETMPPVYFVLKGDGLEEGPPSPVERQEHPASADTGQDHEEKERVWDEMHQAASPVTATKAQEVTAAFPPLEEEPASNGVRNIDLILDVPLSLTVELGRTVRSIREVLELSPGSLIELDRMAGEAVDILVNNRLIAKGEVVVIDENFGVRITDIISPSERLQKLR